MTTVADLANKINTTKTGFKTKAKAKPKPATTSLLTSPSGPAASAPAVAQQPVGLGYLEAQNINSNPAPTPAPKSANSSTDFAALAASIFAPQMADLNNQAGALKSQAGAADSQLAGLYANLVKSINGDANYYNQDYKSALSDLNKTGTGTVNAINNTYDTSAAKEAALLQRLGIQQAAPDALAQGTVDRNFFTDLSNSNTSAYQNQFNSQHKADLTWNKQQGEISQLQGTDARAKVAQSLQSALAQLASQRASLLSQQRSEGQTLQQQQAQNDLALAKLQMGSGSTAKPVTPAQPKGLQGLLAQEASAVGYNAAQAPNAIKAINDSVSNAGPGQADTLQHFLAYVHSRNAKANDWGQLQDLAEYLWAQTNGHIQ